MLNFLKWSATVVLCIGGAINAAGIQPLGIYSLLTGGFIWLLASIKMKEKSLIVTNGVMVLFTITGLFFNSSL